MNRQTELEHEWARLQERAASDSSVSSVFSMLEDIENDAESLVEMRSFQALRAPYAGAERVSEGAWK